MRQRGNMNSPFPSSAFLFHSDLSGLNVAYPHQEEPSASPSLLIQMLIFSGNRFADTSRNNVWPNIWAPCGQTSWHIKLTITTVKKRSHIPKNQRGRVDYRNKDSCIHKLKELHYQMKVHVHCHLWDIENIFWSNIRFPKILFKFSKFFHLLNFIKTDVSMFRMSFWLLSTYISVWCISKALSLNFDEEIVLDS